MYLKTGISCVNKLLSYWVTILLFLFAFPYSFSQNIIYYQQGFESVNGTTCPENLPYTGGVRSAETARSDYASLRIGRNGESNTFTTNPVSVANLSNAVLSVYHSVRGGQGPGMDTREGAAFLISLDGGPYNFISGVSGFGDHNYPWTASSGGSTSASSGCNAYQTPNPFVFTIPAGTSTISLRVISVGRANSSCTVFNNDMTSGTASNYDRVDEAFYIDDIEISALAPSVNASGGGTFCGNSPLSLQTNNASSLFTYSWTGPNNFSSNQQNPLVSNSPTSVNSGTYTNTVLVNNCPIGSYNTSVTVINPVQPSFTPPPSYCQGENIPSLPTTSTNNIQGTWSPSINNQTTTNYTFTPINSACATSTNLIITVNPTVTPTFTLPSTYCFGATIPNLPTNSNNNVSGTWSPAINNQATTTYTFQPTAGQCATTTNTTITIDQQVQPTFPNFQPICVGSSTPLPNTSNNGISGTWSPIFNPNQTENYTFTPAANFCATTASAQIQVVNGASVAVNNPSVCPGSSATLTAVPSTSGGQLIWSNGSTSSSITVSPTQTSTYSVTFTGTGCTASQTGTVTILPQPFVSLDGTSICVGEDGTITAIGTPSGGNYSWAHSDLNTATIDVNPNQTSSYTVSYSVNGCNATPATAVVTVVPLPIVQLAAINTCPNVAFPVNSNVSPAGGDYLWSNGATTNQTNLTASANTNYSLTYTVNGCSASNSANVTVVNLPEISFFSPSTNLCAPASFQLINNTQQLEGVNFTWQIGNNSYSSNSPDFNVSLSQPNCYDVKLIQQLNGCSSEVLLEDYLCVVAPPQASFQTQPGYFSQTEQNIQFLNTSSSGDFFQWNFGDGSLSNDAFPTHFFTETENGYTVNLIAYSSAGCSDTFSRTIIYREELIYYIPNTFTPDGDQYNQVFKPVFSSSLDLNNFKMTIWNKWGEIVFQTTDPFGGWDGSFGNLGVKVQNGTYIYQISAKSVNSTDPVLINGNVNLLR